MRKGECLLLECSSFLASISFSLSFSQNGILQMEIQFAAGVSLSHRHYASRDTTIPQHANSSRQKMLSLLKAYATYVIK
jgi:hypothetical protein